MAQNDPRNRGRSISPELLKQIAESKKNKKKDWHWSLTLTVSGLILGSIVVGLVMSFTMLSYLWLAVFVLALALVSFLAQWRYFYSLDFIKNNFRLPLAIYAFYNIVGIAIPTAALLLVLNWVLASGTEDVERVKIVGLDRSYVLDSQLGAPLLLENDAYKNEVEIRTFEYLKAIKWRQHPILEIVTYKGLFGIRIYKESRMSGDPLPEENVVEETVEVQSEELVDTLQTDSVLVDSIVQQ